MESLGHSIAVAEKLHSFIHSEAKATDNKVTSPQEASEAKDAKAKVNLLLRPSYDSLNRLTTIGPLRYEKHGYAC